MDRHIILLYYSNMTTLKFVAIPLFSINVSIFKKFSTFDHVEKFHLSFSDLIANRLKKWYHITGEAKVLSYF